MYKLRRVYTTLKALYILKIYTISEKPFKNTGFNTNDIKQAKTLIYKLALSSTEC